MKKIVFLLYNLDTGGIEKSMINLLKNIDYKKYQVSIILQNKVGCYLKDIPKEVNVKNYSISKSKNIFLRKIINRLKIIFYSFFNYHKYDVSICYATYDIPSAILTRYIGKKTIIWIHSDYSLIYNKCEMLNFFNIRKISKFNNIVFVSNEARENFTREYINLKDKTFVIGNVINQDEIVNKSLVKNNIKKNKYAFLFVGRLEEKSKNLSNLLEAFSKFKNDDVELWIVGDGVDSNNYKELVRNNKISNVKFFGNQVNPYPYMKIANCLILTSNYEGFPVVYLEALTLNMQIVSTIDVSIKDFFIKDYAYICDKNIDSIYDNMRKAINNPKKYTFQVEDFNKNNLKLFEKIMR